MDRGHRQIVTKTGVPDFKRLASVWTSMRMQSEDTAGVNKSSD